MNIFVVHEDPISAAQGLCDKHVGKMLIETAQLLSTVQWLSGHRAPYRPTHVKHPCTKWLQESRENYMWAWLHGMALYEEFEYRFGTKHKSGGIVELLDTPVGPNIKLTPFAQAMPVCYKSDNAVESYRNYYRGEKRYFAKWEKGRKAPNWWHIGEQHALYGT